MNLTGALAFSLLLSLTAAQESSARQSDPEGSFSGMIAEIFERAERTELSGGMIHHHIHEPEQSRITIVFQIATGPVFDPPTRRGLARMTTEVMKAGGSSSITGNEISEILASIDGSIDVQLTRTMTVVTLDVPLEALETGLSLCADMLMDPAFPQDKIALARIAILEDLIYEEPDAFEQAYRKMHEVVYGWDSPYTATADRESLYAITRGDMIAFHRTYFRPSNVIVGTWGSPVSSDIAETLQMAFAGWADPPGSLPRLPDLMPHRGPSLSLIHRPGQDSSVVLVGHAGHRLGQAEYAATLVLDAFLAHEFVLHPLSDTLASSRIRTRYGAELGFPGLFFASIKTPAHTTVQATRFLIDEIEKLGQELPEPGAVARARERLLRTPSEAGMDRSSILARMLNHDYLGLPRDHVALVREAIRQIRPADVRFVAEKFLDSNTLHIIVVGDESRFDKPLSVLESGRKADGTPD